MSSCPWSSSGNMERIIEALKDKLMCTMLELESAKKELNQEKQKTQKTIRHFLHLIKVALQEKDEAQKQSDEVRNQLQLLKKANTSPLSSSSDYDNISNSTHTQKFYLAPAAPTLASAGSSNAGLEKQPRVVGMEMIRSSSMRERDSVIDSLVYDSLIEWISSKPLPQKGRLLQAVVEAGPLLQPLLIAPLPQWKNPPKSTTTLPLPLPVFQDSIMAHFAYANEHNSSVAYNPHTASTNFKIDQIPCSSVFKHC